MFAWSPHNTDVISIAFAQLQYKTQACKLKKISQNLASKDKYGYKKLMGIKSKIQVKILKKSWKD